MKKSILLSLVLLCSMHITAQQYPFQNRNLSAKERAEDLCSRLTLEEKASLMLNSSPAIERLGIREFSWWSEALHGVARNGYATVYPSCIGMAASFDDALLYKVYSQVSDEGRAKHTATHKAGMVKQYQGVSFWTPNINIFRDPRWGRGQETYGEDPYLTGRMGSIVVRGLQGEETKNGYYKTFACAKHYAVHSGPESTRHTLNLDDVSPRDLWETYLPAFRKVVKDGGVKEVMCAYQRIDGDPCCGSNRLLTQILRNEWGFDGVVVSDCGAIDDFFKKGHHEIVPDAQAAAGRAVLSGTDVNCGKTYKHLPEAVRNRYISEKELDVSVKRLLEGRFLLGDFDDDAQNPWTQIPLSCVASKEHKQTALEMARETMVLLQNKNKALPLKKNEKFIVMGPNANDSIMLWGIYYGKPTHSVTVVDGIKERMGRAPYYQACELVSFNEKASKNIKRVVEYGTDKAIEESKTQVGNFSIASALTAARDYKTVIFVGGISPVIEREEAKVDLPGFMGGDRTSIELPQVQRDIIAALHKAGKKVVLVNCSGSAVALTPEVETCDAILQAWYSGEQGGLAVADVLTGAYNPSGKLPVTFYKDDSALGDFEDYSMKGKTYRYLNTEPLFPFGFGLSYTSFKIMSAQFDKSGKSIDVVVKNTGKRTGTETVQLYMRCAEDAEGPMKTLRGYGRITLNAGKTGHLSIACGDDVFERFDTDTNTMRSDLKGDYELLIGTSSSDCPIVLKVAR